MKICRKLCFTVYVNTEKGLVPFVVDAIFNVQRLFVQHYLQKQRQINGRQNQRSASLNLSSGTIYMCPDKSPSTPRLH